MRFIPKAGLKSRVARRLFAMFILAAQIPAAGIALFAQTEVSQALIDINNRRLQQDAKSLGMGLIQRILWREQAFEKLRSQLAAVPPDNLATSLPERTDDFSALRMVDAEALATLSEAKRTALAESRVVLHMTDPEGPVMYARIPQSSQLLQARLDTRSLWETEESAVPYCIFRADKSPLFCTPDLPTPPMDRVAATGRLEKAGGVFEWQLAGADQLAAYWRGSVQASLSSDGFVIVVSESKEEALYALDRFRQMVPPILILAMALAAWLAVTQIRRQMKPLDLLEEGTRRLAQGDLSSRVELPGNDEFANLAKSFNRMSESLDHKFHLVETLGELDRAILATSEMDYVVDTLLQHVGQAVPCDAAGILRFDENGVASLRSIEDGRSVEAVTDSGGEYLSNHADWKAFEPWFAVDLHDTRIACLRTFAAQGMQQALIFPALVNQRLDRALVLAYRNAPESRDEIIQSGRGLADRLSIAASNIAWEDKLYHQAHFDALTDLPNRVMLRDRIQQALLRAERESLSVALMIVDLDDFKHVNDSLGHAAGDTLLQHVSACLESQARVTDTVARLGGDEFVVLLPDLPPANAVETVDRVARKLNASLARSITIEGQSVSAAASIGISLYPQNAAAAEELMTTADAAMYEAKRHQRGTYQFYSSEMNTEIRTRFEIAQELRAAMEKEEFILHYQPKIDAQTGRISGAEALVRWRSPKRGMVPPGMFIQVIDEIGLGPRLGEWVMNAACRQMFEWDARGLPPVKVSVNVSPAQFRSDAMVEQVRKVLADNYLTADRLELEVLESMAVSDTGESNATLTELRKMHINIALDDFGTGYSSLIYLTQLPANVLKIDRGFITDIAKDKRQLAIVERIISLAKVLDYTVVAEGVEDAEQQRLLGEMGCDIFQGFHFSRPLSPEDFEALLRRETEPIVATTPA